LNSERFRRVVTVQFSRVFDTRPYLGIEALAKSQAFGTKPSQPMRSPPNSPLSAPNQARDHKRSDTPPEKTWPVELDYLEHAAHELNSLKKRPAETTRPSACVIY